MRALQCKFYGNDYAVDMQQARYSSRMRQGQFWPEYEGGLGQTMHRQLAYGTENPPQYLLASESSGEIGKIEGDSPQTRSGEKFW